MGEWQGDATRGGVGVNFDDEGEPAAKVWKQTNNGQQTGLRKGWRGRG